MKFDKVTPPAAAVFFVLAWKRTIRVVDTSVWVDAGEGKTKGRRKTESDSNVSTLRVEGEERRFALLYHRTLREANLRPRSFSYRNSYSILNVVVACLIRLRPKLKSFFMRR